MSECVTDEPELHDIGSPAHRSACWLPAYRAGFDHAGGVLNG